MVELKASDGMRISGTFYKSASETRDAIILLHMLGRNRNDWNDFAHKLQQKYCAISIDFRGHGESAGELESFSPTDFGKFILDVKAAADFLDRQGKKAYAAIGGSIGANLALLYASEYDLERVVALSPGLDYRGVRTEEAARKFLGKVLFVASEDDSYSAASARRLYEATLAKKQLKIYQNAGHGTSMFASTDLDELILNWLKG